MATALDFSALEKQYGLPSGILNAVMQQESGGRMDAVSPKGAQGPFQFMPATAQELGIDPFDMNQAADGAARYLSQNLQKFGKPELALAAYNAGPGAVQKHGGIPPFEETQNYIGKVMANLEQPQAGSEAVAELPPGFQLDSADSASPDLPAGFEIDEVEPSAFANNAAQFLIDKFGEENALKLSEAGKSAIKGATEAADLGSSFMQGRTFGLGPKALSAAVTLPQKAILEGVEAFGGNEAPSIGDLYKGNVEGYQGRVGSAYDEHPVLAPVAEGLGALRTGLQFGKTNAGQRVGNWLSGPGAAKTAPLTEKALRLMQRAGKGALAGEAGYRAYKVGTAAPGEEAMELVSGFPVGGATGGAAPVIAGAVGTGVSAVAPKVDEGLKAVAELAKKYDIPLSMDQITSSRPVKNIQKLSQELPFSGVGKFKDQQMAAFNRALTSTFGQESDSITPELMDKAFNYLGKQFDDLGKGKSFDLGDDFVKYIDDVTEEAKSIYSDEAVTKFQKEVGKIYDNVIDGKLTGERAGIIRGKLNRLARKTNDADLKELYRDLENGVIELMTQGDEAAKGAFSKTKQQYKNLLAIEPLAAKSKGGTISPTQLSTRASKIYGRQYTRGKAGELGDLARIGNELLPTPGGSDTVQKALFAGGATYFEPTATISTLGLNKAYQSWINQNPKVISKMLEDEFLKIAAPQTLSIGAGAAAGASKPKSVVFNK